MPAHRSGRRRSHHEEEHENEERWLLSYADMITLLMVLFVVLFAISSVNTAKLDALSASLSEEISGKIVTGGPSIRETGGADSTKPAAPTAAIPPIQPVVETESAMRGQPGGHAAGANREEENFRKLKQEIDAYASEHSLQASLQTRVARRGLVIRLLTDRVLFASGAAQLEPASRGLLSALARLLRAEVRHPIIVEGHTDKRAVNTAQFPTNWELSTTRATQVVRYFIDQRVPARRLQAAGVAAQRPLASNASESGRSRNRRVEIVLARLNTPSTSQDGP